MKNIRIIHIILMLTIFTISGVCLSTSAENDNREVKESQKIQSTPTMAENKVPPEEPEVKNLGNGRLQIGNIIIDEDKKEVTIPGRLNMLEGPIEFIASTKGGMKLYESVLEMDTDAMSFNLSMILLGLDPKKGKAAAYHFDPSPPQGDAVEISIQWDTEDGKKTIPVQEIIHDMDTGKIFPADKWVYTGSIFLDDGQYLADLAGALIGFVHDPASILESHFSGKFPPYGTYMVNTNHSLSVGTEIRMIIRPIETKEKNRLDAGNKRPEKS
jgi:hypothetical protein